MALLLATQPSPSSQAFGLSNAVDVIRRADYGEHVITLGILVATLIWLPLLAAGVLAVYPRVLALQRILPADEYAQAIRAPAWFVVVIGGALCALALWAAMLAAAPVPGVVGGDQVLYGTRSGPLLMADAYTLWGCALLGAVLALGTWVPAARRSAVLPTDYPFPVLLVLYWLAQLALLSIRFPFTLVCWLLLVGGAGAYWVVIFRPARRWRAWELPAVLGFAAVLLLCGLAWLHRLADGQSLLLAWSNLATVSVNYSNGVVLLLAMGWLGPALYLPWWIWNRRDEPAMLWLPVVLVISVAAQLVFIHVLFLAFPAIGQMLTQGAGLDPHFLVKRTMNWMMLWGLVALLAGSLWLAWYQVLRVPFRFDHLRPLSLVSGGLLLIGISVGLQSEPADGLLGLLWLQLGWVGVTVVWLTAGGLLSALTARETLERSIVQLACWLGLVVLVGAPPGPGFRGLSALWAGLAQLSMPRGLILFCLVVTGVCLVVSLPRWADAQQAPAPRAGAAWGILAPFLPALLLIVLGLLGGALVPFFQLVGESLLQMTN